MAKDTIGCDEAACDVRKVPAALLCAGGREVDDPGTRDARPALCPSVALAAAHPIAMDADAYGELMSANKISGIRTVRTQNSRSVVRPSRRGDVLARVTKFGIAPSSVRPSLACGFAGAWSRAKLDAVTTRDGCEHVSVA